MPPETENLKTDEIGTTDGEAVQVAESVSETAPTSAEGYGLAKQNEPKMAESPTCESGQLGGIDSIVSVETSKGEGALPPNRFRRKPKRLQARKRQFRRQ
jgi:hypothetical protein